MYDEYAYTHSIKPGNNSVVLKFCDVSVLSLSSVSPLIISSIAIVINYYFPSPNNVQILKYFFF